MRYYTVTKWSNYLTDDFTKTEYGKCCDADVKLITRGYKPDKDDRSLYTRKGSKSFYEVEEVKEK